MLLPADCLQVQSNTSVKHHCNECIAAPAKCGCFNGCNKINKYSITKNYTLLLLFQAIIQCTQLHTILLPYHKNKDGLNKNSHYLLSILCQHKSGWFGFKLVRIGKVMVSTFSFYVKYF